jgi:cytochrome c556
MRILMLVAVAASLTACVAKKDLPAEEITKLTKLDDVMAAQATIADPQFKKIGQATYADADWAAFADTGARLQASSLKIKDFTKGAEFDALAMRLNTESKSLADAAAAKDAAAASKALADMKATCKECHKKFR